MTSKNPTVEHVGSQYGAPMGRRNTLHPGLVDESLKFQLQKVRLNGDYDQGGAYWGCHSRGSILYVAFTDDGEQACASLYFRAVDRAAAKAHILDLYPNARFYR